jgi:hypothetical protein
MRVPEGFFVSERYDIFGHEQYGFGVQISHRARRATSTRDGFRRRRRHLAQGASAKPGTVFTPGLFVGLGGRAAVDEALQRLAARGVLRRLSKGVYDKPRQDPMLGVLWPSVDAVVAALMGRDKLRLQPTGAYAASLLGLSGQVPARVEFLTEGTTVKAGPMQIVLKRTTPRHMAAAGRTSGLVIQALRSFGPSHLIPERLEHFRRGLPDAERQTLLKDLALAPGWLQPILRSLTAEDQRRPGSRLKPTTPCRMNSWLLTTT